MAKSVPLSWAVGWDTVDWVRVSAFAGQLWGHCSLG